MKRFLSALAVLLVPLTVAAAGPPVLNVGMDDLDSRLRRIPVGGEAVLEGLEESVGRLTLERFDAFTPDAEIVVHHADGEVVLPRPDNAYFKGRIEGDPSSRVTLSVVSNGLRGVASSAGSYWLLGRGDAARAPISTLVAVEADSIPSEVGFECLTDRLGDVPMLEVPEAASRAPLAPPAERATSPTYAAKVAVETDQEFLALFGGDTSAATNYVGDLIAYGSTVYSDEVDTALTVSHVSLWATTDPWRESSRLCCLFEFGRYWNENNTAIERTVAHFMSGKSNNGGVAWVGVLCGGAFSYDHGGSCSGLTPRYDNYGGDYGYSGTMDGDFDINNPSVVWDIVVTTHEMGHNFNSPHTHCYAGIGGSEDVDHCYGSQGGCYSGSTSLPFGCPGGGQGCGTIMSYCHLLSGGMSNVAMTFGLDHAYGVLPGRVPARMNGFVQATALGNPSCLAPVSTNLIFGDGFESGDVSAWSASVP